MISFSKVSKQYGRQVLFVDASFQLNPGEKVGLVGPNGSGKTTLFRMITGEETADEGEVSVPKKLTIGYFRQDVEEMSGRSVLDEAIHGSGRVGDLHHELEALQNAMSDPAQADDNLRCKQLCDAEGRYAFTTVEPGPYTIPTDGPVGELVTRMRRSPWRPAHYHFIVRAEGHRPIVTEIFFPHDPYLGSDAVFGVRAPLVRDISPVESSGGPPVPTQRRPLHRIDFDFTLMPVAS